MGSSRLGLIVNPIAGLGGRVGLKGTDGEATVRSALAMGAVAEAPMRAVSALQRLSARDPSVRVVTFAGEMGADAAGRVGLGVEPVGEQAGNDSTAGDTIRAAQAMLRAHVDLVLFVGGDGTARDIYDAVGDRVPCLGVPAGVKIQSAVFAVTPSAAGDLAGRFLAVRGERLRLREAEVMDIDEGEVRHDRVASRLYGFLQVPYDRGWLQGAKAGTPFSDEAAMAGIASEVVAGMDHPTTYLLGPGTTTRAIAERLCIPSTLLGVDAVREGRSAGSDLNEGQILDMLKAGPAKIVVTVIGGQGYVFGRGNQQMSPSVIRRVGPQNVIVVATRNKLLALGDQPLWVDTGDEALDARLAGHVQVVTGVRERTVVRLESWV